MGGWHIIKDKRKDRRKMTEANKNTRPGHKGEIKQVEVREKDKKKTK